VLGCHGFVAERRIGHRRNRTASMPSARCKASSSVTAATPSISPQPVTTYGGQSLFLTKASIRSERRESNPHRHYQSLCAIRTLLRQNPYTERASHTCSAPPARTVLSP